MKRFWRNSLWIFAFFGVALLIQALKSTGVWTDVEGALDLHQRKPLTHNLYCTDWDRLLKRNSKAHMSIPAEFNPSPSGGLVFFRYEKKDLAAKLSEGGVVLGSNSYVFGIIECKEQDERGDANVQDMWSYMRSLSKEYVKTIAGNSYYLVAEPDQLTVFRKGYRRSRLTLPSKVYYVSEMDRFFGCRRMRCTTVFDGSEYAVYVSFPEPFFFSEHLPAIMDELEMNLESWGL